MYRFVLLFLLLTPQLIFGQDITHLDMSQSPIPLVNTYYYLDDKDLSFDEIKKESFQSSFKLSHSQQQNYSYTNKSLWLKFRLKSNTRANNWMLDFGKNNLSLVELYYTDLHNKQWNRISTGTSIKYGERSLNIRPSALPLEIEAFTSKEYYVKITSKSALTIFPTIFSNSNFLEKNGKEELFYGMLFGVLVFAFFNIFYLALRTSYKRYIYFSIFTFCQILLFVYKTGYLNSIVSIPFSSHLVYFLYLCGTFGGNLFAVTFFDLKEKNKSLYWGLLLSILAILLGFIVSLFLSDALVMKLIILFILLNGLFVFIVCLMLFLKGVKEARYFSLGILGFIFFIGTYILHALSIIDYNFISSHAVSLSTLLVVLFFYFSLTDRQSIKLRAEKKEAAKKMALKDKSHKKLESIVNLTMGELQNINALLEEKQQELENHQISLERSNNSKDKLISIIAHDFKSPLNSLKGAVSLLQMGVLSKEEVVELADKLDIQINDTLDFVNNLLYWAKSQMYGIEITPSHMDLMKVINNVVKLLQPTANDKNISIQIDTSNEAVVWADPNTIDIIVRNLITNGIKFTRSGGLIEVSLREDHDFWEVCIKDNGVGIPPDLKAHLFDSDDSTAGTAAEKGTGLGLLLCKQFVEKNGGTIWVNSKPKQGSAFYFTLYKQEFLSV